MSIFGALTEKHGPPNELFEVIVSTCVQTIFTESTFSHLLSRELLDGGPDRLEYLFKTFLKEPFFLMKDLMTQWTNLPDPDKSASSVAAIIMGYFLVYSRLQKTTNGIYGWTARTLVTEQILRIFRPYFNRVIH